MLGIRLQGDTLVIDPVIPRNWPQFEVTFRHRDTTYEILVENPARFCRGIAKATLDGTSLDSAAITLVDDGNSHQIHITMGVPARNSH
jgi:cyclic beta-1,2-glucan synthetase